MVLWALHHANDNRDTVPIRIALEYSPEMPMWRYLRDVIAPACGLMYLDGTVRAKVHTPELRVVFNNEVTGVQLGTLVRDCDFIVISPWPRDNITMRSLEGNARELVHGMAVE